MGVVVLCDPGNGQRGLLRGAVSGVFHRPVDIDGAVGILVVNALGRCQLGRGGWCLHDDPGKCRQADVLTLGVGVRHGDPHRVGRGISAGEIGEHILRDPHAVFLFASGIRRNGLDAAQLRLIRVVARIQVNPVMELFVRCHQRGVGAPQHGGGLIYPRHDGRAAGNHQCQGIACRHGIGL